ncbi:MAG: HD domain-containing protein [Candidatus Uhrbacteria bacterium]|nr:HD domain-containing protein [Candidatus Uhrbacteria bacterium]
MASAVSSLRITHYALPPRALIVGGFVRDALLNITSDDLDMEVYGVPVDDLQALLEKLYPKKLNLIGRSFGIFHVTFDDGFEFEISIPRRDSKTGTGHKGFTVEGDPTMSVEDAARRRDFTINSILADPMTGEVIDPFDGRSDLDRKILRVTDQKTFQDDPLRVYRAVQLTARLQLTVEPESFDLMRIMIERGDLAELSPERVTEEIRKLLLKAERPSLGLQMMFELGIIERDYPELFVLKQTPQEPEWHPEGDVWIHTLMVVDQAAKIIRRETWNVKPETSEKLQVMLGALCHDLGKPSTTKMGEKAGVPRLRSLGHEEAGEEPTRMLCKKWMFGETIEHGAIMSAMQHLKPGTFYRAKEQGKLNDEQYANAVRKLLKKIYPLSWRVLLASAEADHRGRSLPGADSEPYEAGEIFTRTIEQFKLDEAPIKPLIQGRDLMDRGIKPGPRMGQIIAEIETARDEGKIKTREEALELLGTLL